ncbi:hypothetical protein NKH23_30485 [Mesorhizobium sp. M1328]|uniref:hypothetical protein n=1 Tax=Mesorhizobium sp. M1328 TaxID=2957082 RepID=UPI003334E3BA
MAGVDPATSHREFGIQPKMRGLATPEQVGTIPAAMQQSWWLMKTSPRCPVVRFHRTTWTFAAAKCRKSRRALKIVRNSIWIMTADKMT